MMTLTDKEKIKIQEDLIKAEEFKNKKKKKK